MEVSETRGCGSGTTINISSRGVLIRTRQSLPINVIVKLSVKWPVALEECALKLILRGRVIRSNDETTAIRFENHEFRITKAGAC